MHISVIFVKKPMSIQLEEIQPEDSKIPASIKLVEEGEIDAENIQEGFEHKLFYQRTEKQPAEQLQQPRSGGIEA